MKVACSDLEIDFQTGRRWREDLADKKKGPLSSPKNKLTDEEKNEVIKLSISKEYMDYSQWVIVAKLADK